MILDMNREKIVLTKNEGLRAGFMGQNVEMGAFSTFEPLQFLNGTFYHIF